MSRTKLLFKAFIFHQFKKNQFDRIFFSNNLYQIRCVCPVFLGNRRNTNQEISEILDSLRKGLDIAENIQDLEWQALLKSSLGRYIQYKHSSSEERKILYQEAENYLEKARKFFNQTGNDLQEAFCLHNLGMLEYYKKRNTDIAITLLEKSSLIYHKIGA